MNWIVHCPFLLLRPLLSSTGSWVLGPEYCIHLVQLRREQCVNRNHLQPEFHQDGTCLTHCFDWWPLDQHADTYPTASKCDLASRCPALQDSFASCTLNLTTLQRLISAALMCISIACSNAQSTVWPTVSSATLTETSTKLN